LTPASFAGLKTSPEDTLAIITMVQADIEKMIEWNVEAIDAELRSVADKLEKKLRVVTPPLFIAMSGSQRSLPLFDSMAILGRSVVRQRLKIAAAVVSSMVGAQK
ncbi:MAG: glutamate--tRNA ligase, partial [Rhizobiaceae bacterium]